jgi:hypothetical protein
MRSVVVRGRPIALADLRNPTNHRWIRVRALPPRGDATAEEHLAALEAHHVREVDYLLEVIRALAEALEAGCVPACGGGRRRRSRTGGGSPGTHLDAV